MGSAPSRTASAPGQVHIPHRHAIEEDYHAPHTDKEQGHETLEKWMSDMKLTLECPICQESMDTNSRRPKNIGCAHTICLECLMKLPELCCPMCKRKIVIPPGGREMLPDNVTIKDIAERFLAKESEIKSRRSDYEREQQNLCKLPRHQGNNKQWKIHSLCQTCRSVMCSDCGNYDNSCTSSSSKHDLIPVAPLLDSIKIELQRNYNECVAEMNKVVEVLTKAQEMLKDQNMERVLIEGSALKDSMVKMQVVEGPEPRPPTRPGTSFHPLVPISLAEPNVMDAFALASYERAWQVKKASAICITKSLSIIITTNSGSEEGTGIQVYSLSGSLKDGFFPRLGNFRGLSLIGKKELVVVNISTNELELYEAESANKLGRFDLTPMCKEPMGVVPVVIGSERRYLVADYGSNTVKMYSAQGKWLKDFSHADLKGPYCLAITKYGFVATSSRSHCVLCFDFDGNVRWFYGGCGSERGKLNSPVGICIDKYEQIYIADWQNDRIVVLNSEGNWVRYVLENEVTKPVMLSIHENHMVIRQENCDIKLFKLVGG